MLLMMRIYPFVLGNYLRVMKNLNKNWKNFQDKVLYIIGDETVERSIRTNCQAHIMLRASKDGTKLEVTSVNNEHNHEISEELFKNLPQERKLCGEIKQEVQDLMQLHIDRKRLKEYVRLRTNKILRSKDLFNIAAANKHKKEITPERAYQLFKKIHDIENIQKKEFIESEDEMTHTIKRMKTEKDTPCWAQNSLSVELETSEGNDVDDTYCDPLMQEESVDEISNGESQLVSATRDTDMISVNGEIVGELVMEDGDPSVIVESIVNADGSVFVDEREFNTYPLSSSVHDSQSPNREVLSPETITTQMDDEKIKRINPSSSPSSSTHFVQKILSNRSSPNHPLHDSEKIWVVKEGTTLDTEADSGAESEANGVKTNIINQETNNIREIMIADEREPLLIHQKLAVLKAEEEKLFHETEMIKLKKEKLRLEIKLLQSKVMEDTNDVSHYIFVP
ncbi:uncharacterized protein LOC127285158 isoform X2 [Leptopilina boulardi]|uniref:uncharacterized protein LOC127285158 isoform X2 n=1 Tax=Leptopilina boulardi TaxID=63433 RepID=UPI0021F591C1|nr:uncharacterized protein LOC127285158 isoform X2 [Leptopilina boulardi]XP_051166967.1 uncharacterized protein LOC127285158 isoform X2 [Leptopilina boulardi]XP_051166968.1 uncharacterized protein LOC127285158 isoform X2 [Leptopilina boulardi]XP_051166969.1 uncharacterized protein LOC127285158 isoform X2 [Leptopilina boulardi]